MLKIIPLGGLGEIGMNMMVLEYEDTIVIIDSGLMFPEDYMYGVDYVIPDMSYIRQNKSKVAAVILTHGHEDHIGALPHLLREVNVPVYGTLFTLEMVRYKLEEQNLLANVSLKPISPKGKLQITPFEFEFIRVNHSIVDGVGLGISTPEGLIVHTGDFKLSESSMPGMMTDIASFARLGEKGVLALFSDSTNVEKEGHTISDQQIGNTLENIILRSKGRVIVALFASNIPRIQQLIEIAKTRGRKVVINGKSIELSVNIAAQLNMLKIPDGIVIDVDAIDNFMPDEILIITTGTQGEPRSSLTRMASGTHSQIQIESGDTVILSSKFIPGNEKAIAGIINNLFRKGAEVIYEKVSEIHVSGHAFREELKMMIGLTNPRYFVPIHGEYRHLVHHVQLAQECGIPEERLLLSENGQVIEFDSSTGKIAGAIETSRILVDGKGVGDVGRFVLKERRKLSEEGFVIVNLAIEKESGSIVFGPEIVSKGFVFEQETGHILEDAKCVVLEILEDTAQMDGPDRIEALKKKVQRELREYFTFSIRRKPLILPFILEV